MQITGDAYLGNPHAVDENQKNAAEDHPHQQTSEPNQDPNSAATQIQRIQRGKSARNQKVKPQEEQQPSTISSSPQQPVPINVVACSVAPPDIDEEVETNANTLPVQVPVLKQQNHPKGSTEKKIEQLETKEEPKNPTPHQTTDKPNASPKRILQRPSSADPLEKKQPSPRRKSESSLPTHTEYKTLNATKSRPTKSKSQVSTEKKVQKKSNPNTKELQPLSNPIPFTIPHPHVTPPPPPHSPGPHVSENVSEYMLLSEKVKKYTLLIKDLEKDQQLKELHKQKDELTKKQSTTEDEDKLIEKLKIDINQRATEKENEIKALHQEIFVNTGIEDALKTYASTKIEDALTMSAKSWETTLLQNFAIEVQNGSITPDLRNNPDAIAYFNEYYKFMGVQINLNTASTPLPPSSPRHTPAPESPKIASPRGVADIDDVANKVDPTLLTPRAATSSTYRFSELPNEQKYKPFIEAGFQKLTIPGNGDCLPVSLILKELMEAQALLNDGNRARMEELYNLLKAIFDNDTDKEKLIYHNCTVVIDTLKDIIDGKNDLSLYNIFYDVCNENDYEYAHMFCQGLAKLARLSVVPLCIEKFSETFFQEYLKSKR